MEIAKKNEQVKRIAIKSSMQMEKSSYSGTSRIVQNIRKKYLSTFQILHNTLVRNTLVYSLK